MTHIFDIDGTLVYYHTNNWITGALEFIENAHNRGDKIVLITMRGPQDRDKEWSVQNTMGTVIKDLNSRNIPHTVLWGMPSPRAIHDDAVIFANKRKTNQEWIV